MDSTNVCKSVYVLKQITFVTVMAFTFSSVKALALSPKEKKNIDQVVGSLKRNQRCESVVLSSNNLSTVYWLKNGTLKSSQPFWSADSRQKLTKMIKNLKVNHKVIDLNLPTRQEFEMDPYKTSQVISRMTTDALNEFKWKGNLDCKAKAFVPKAQFLLNLIGQFTPSAEANTERAGSRRVSSPAPILPGAASDESVTAQNLATALKKRNSNGACKSFLIESKNLTAVMWIEDAQLVSGGYLWSKEARKKFKDSIKDTKVVKRTLKRSLPTPYRYSKDPVASAQMLEAEFEKAFRQAKAKQEFRCGLAAIN